MSEKWTEVVEDGQVFWINDELGNVVKIGTNMYVAMMPKVVKMGPFDTLEHAKQALSLNKKAVDNVLENLNTELVALSKQK